MSVTLVLFIIGFVLLIGGAQMLIMGASSLGSKFGVSQMIMGLTVVALGTSLPELVVNIFASAKGNSALAIGNVLGSNITNTLLVVGVSALIFPVFLSKNTLKRDLPFSLFILVILFILANDRFFGRPNMINRGDGVILLLFFLVFGYFLFKRSRNEESESLNFQIKEYGLGIDIIFIFLGGLGLYFGGEWIANGAVTIADLIGITSTAMGLTIISGATSLPELITSILASRKKNTDMALGNAIGSNIINVLLVLGITAVIKPIPFQDNLNVEIGLVILAGIIVWISAKTGKIKNQLGRWQGAVLVLLYVAFIYFSTTYQ